MARTPVVDEEELALDEVICWRFAELLTAGYEVDSAVELAARTDVDLHLAVELQRRGCPQATALRILL
jgi:hypothetical protein